MNKINNVLFLILARSGSKGIPGKNIKKLNGLPLMAYRIKTALSLTSKDNVWVSTDNNDYKNIAIEYGASVPFLRPESLSADDSSSIDAVIHALNWASDNSKSYKYICLLEPTSPFVQFKYIAEALSIVKKEKDLDGVCSTTIMKKNSFLIQNESKYLDVLYNRIKNRKDYRRQSFQNQITPSGGFYIMKVNALMRKKTFYTDKTLSFILDDYNSIDINNLFDFQLCEFLLKNNIINISKVYKND
tara:strand:- start:4358 stop:5092 length:735 start_codon:yes stop_codon:yes gene_type:complete